MNAHGQRLEGKGGVAGSLEWGTQPPFPEQQRQLTQVPGEGQPV